MARLAGHVDIKEPILKQLEKKKIVTVLGFLEENAEDISNLCKIPFKDVIAIKRNLLSKHALKPTNGLEYYTESLLKAARIPTGIQSLDEELDGGMLTGNLIEICGQSGVGKTQFCFSVAVNTVINFKQTVYYVDTKQDFSAERIKSIADSRGISEEDVLNMLKEIKMKTIEDIYDLIAFLESLKITLKDINCRLVIIDSIPILYTPYIGEQHNIGLDLINYAASLMKQISTEYQVVILVVNLAMHSFEAEENERHWESDIKWMGDLRPALGKAWSHAPSVRLLILKDSKLEDSLRTISIVKSIDTKCGSKCIVRLNNSGITSEN